LSASSPILAILLLFLPYNYMNKPQGKKESRSMFKMVKGKN